MSQPQSTPTSDPRSIWNFLNVVFGVGAAGFVACAVGSFIWTGMLNSIKLHGPKEAVVAVAAGPAAAFSGPALEVTLKPDTTNPMAYNTKEISAKAGQKIKLTFDNKGAIAPLAHNVVVGLAGSKEKLMQLAMAIMTDPKGLEKNYIPEAPEILAHTKLVQPGQTESIEFIVPSAGDYPYLCTFPGHLMMMNGTIKVQ